MSQPMTSGPMLRGEGLTVFPLPPAAFRLLLAEGAAALEKWGLRPAGRIWDADTRAAMEALCRKAEGLSRRQLEKGRWRWYAPWLILLGDQAAGSACFLGPPCAAGWVELGYGLAADFRGKGYMTAAAGLLTAWAMEQPGVRAVRAQTARDNPASCRVLEKCGFRVIRVLQTEEGEEWVWEYGGVPPVL